MRVYKIVAKMLANRLKPKLSRVISMAQSTFVPSRSILDIVFTAFEAIHGLKQKNHGRQGHVTLKIDISKAYDRVNWEYCRLLLIKKGFDDKCVRWIMLCVRTVKNSVKIYGKLVGPIVPYWGFRQGDPLSPCLFILCVEGLSALVEKKVWNGTIHGFRVCRRAPNVSNLLLADVSVFFFKAYVEECNNMKILF